MNELWNHIVADFANIGSPSALAAFGQVVLIDVMLAADNAIVVGALAEKHRPGGRGPEGRELAAAQPLIAAVIEDCAAIHSIRS